MLCDIILLLGGSWQRNASFSKAPLCQSRTVKGSVWIATAELIFPALIFQRFIHDFLYRFIIKVCDSQILIDHLAIKHIPIGKSPATVFINGYRVVIRYFLSTRLFTCEIFCKIKAMFLSVLCHISHITNTIVIGLYRNIQIFDTLILAGRKQGRKIFTSLLD